MTMQSSCLVLSDEVQRMRFGLYGSCSDDPEIQALSVKGDQAGREIIQKLLNDLEVWEQTYLRAGASDTASRDHMAINIARALGLEVR